MDKYEYKVRSEEIKELIAQGEYAQAAEIADTIDWRRVKSVMMLCTISDLYKINRRYEDSHDLLLLAYDRHPGGRNIVYALCELSIRMGNITQALEYCKEYVQIAPRDPGRYILQYKIYEAQEVSLEERIEVLEELKKRDYREKWAYELAYLYHRIGLESKCVDECDEMIVWFGDGKYVIKAMELKMLHQPLTPEQQERYNNRFAPQEEIVEEVVEEAVVEEVSAATTTWTGADVVSAEAKADVTIAATRRIPVEEIDIQVKTMEPGQCNTINLQEEVAAGLKELWEGKSPDEEITRAIMAPMMETDSVSQDAVEKALKDLQQPAVEEHSEVFFGATVEMQAVEETVAEVTEALQEVVDETAEEVQEVVEATAEGVQEVAQAVTEEAEETVDSTAATVMAQLRQERTAEPPKEMEQVLSMEADGQISFVMPEKEVVEKQITGQISIADIMAEWERMKKELEEKNREKVRQRVKENTGQMFTEFEAAVRDGLLEQLENGRDAQSVIAEAEGRLEEDDDIPVPPSLLEEEAEEEGFVEDYEEITAEEAHQAVETVVVTKAAEEVVEAIEQEVFEEEPVEVVEQEVVEEEPAEVVEQEVVEEESVEVVEQEVFEEALVESVEEEVVEEESVEYVEQETAEKEPAEVFVDEEVADAESEEVLTDRDEVEELAEIEEATEEDIPEDDEDAAYEAALLGAIENFDEEEETGIDYETLNIPTHEVEDAVRREAIKLRNLTKEERELFSPYIQGRTSKAQLVYAIENISMAAYTGNIIITGVEGLDTLGLAKNLIRNLQMTDSNFSGKTAKISGESLNKRDVNTVLEGLDNGALIIQRAANMNGKTVEILYKALQQEHRGIVVILEGTKKAINLFLEKNEKLRSCFTARIDMEALTDKALVSFGKKYARELEYAIDDFGVLALHQIITDRQTNDHAVTIMEVKEIVDAAIESANRKTIGHFFDILMAKRYDDEDMIIIREKDFM